MTALFRVSKQTLVQQNLPGAVHRPCDPLAEKSIGCPPTDVTFAPVGKVRRCSTPCRSYLKLPVAELYR